MNWRSLAAAVLLCCSIATAHAVGNLTDVTIYDRAEQRALPVHRHNGRYYVVGTPGSEYRIRVRNRTGGDVLAVVSVDGVNAVSGETADWSQSGYVLRRYESLAVRGWRKSLERVAAFFFTAHANSYAARTGRPDNVGVIGVAVFRRQAEPEARIDSSPPRAEPPISRAHDDSPFPAAADPSSDVGDGSGRSAEAAAGSRHAPSTPAPRKSASLGTGHGRSLSSYAAYARFERATASPEEVIAIYYDTYANLVAMGVLPAPRVALPSPFPGQFVPDPR